MNQALLQHVSAKSARAEVPKIEAGMTVKVSQKIREGEKERIQNFEGLVISTSNGKGIDGTFTVRRIVSGIGVEKVFPLHSKTITKIEVLKQAKVRRSKLYYTRELRGKAARMTESHVREVLFDDDKKEKAPKAEKTEAPTDEAKKEDAPEKEEVAETKEPAAEKEAPKEEAKKEGEEK